MHGNRETSGASAPQAVTDRREKAKCRTARTHAPEESDRGVIPMNRSNNPAQAEAVSEEGRPRIKENVSPTYTLPTQCGKRVSQGLAGVRKVAKERKKERFTEGKRGQTHFHVPPAGKCVCPLFLFLRSLPEAIQPRTSPARHSSSWRVAT
jgi:hypothetical protein